MDEPGKSLRGIVGATLAVALLPMVTLLPVVTLLPMVTLLFASLLHSNQSNLP